MDTLLEDIDVYGLLDNILGEDFRTHIDGLKELGADYFKCKNVKRNKPEGASDNDIHHMFVTMFVGATTAFKYLEKSDPTRSRVLESPFHNRLNKIYQVYSCNRILGANPPSAAPLGPAHGLYKHGDPDIK